MGQQQEGDISSSSLAVPRLRRAPSATVRSAHLALLAIFLAEIAILVYIHHATLVPTPSSAIAAFTSSSSSSPPPPPAAVMEPPSPEGADIGTESALEPKEQGTQEQQLDEDQEAADEEEDVDDRRLQQQLDGPLAIACVAMGRSAADAGNGAAAAASLVQTLVSQLEPPGDGNVEGSSRAYVVGAEDVAQQTEAAQGADMLIVVHEAPYGLVCGKGAAPPKDDAAAADCRQRAAHASALQSGLGLVHGGDMVLHVDGSAMRTLAGAVMVAQELLERWGVDPRAVDVKDVVEGVLLEPAFGARDGKDGSSPDHAVAAARRHCVDAIDRDAVCRAWHDFYYQVWPATAPPVIDDDDVSAWLPSALEAAEAAAAAAAAADTQEEERLQQQGQPQQSPEPVKAQNAWGGKGKQQQEQDDTDENELPHLFYCLPGGGLNDITVEWWHCIEWAIQTGRTLVSGFENYLAAVPPYTPYFELTAIPGLKTMTPAEAARRIRQARRRGQGQGQGKVTVFPRRLQRDPEPILTPVADSEEEKEAILAGERPWRFDWDNLHHLGFEFEKEYGQQVVVFHRKGNTGSGHKTLQSLRLSEEIKRLFLERWGRLQKPYIGLHIRSTDKSCPDAVMQRTLRRTRRLKHVPELDAARQVYLASDNPEVPPNFKRVIEEKQGRAIVSFTYHPQPKNMTGVALPLDEEASPREASERSEHIRRKRQEFKKKGIMPLHLVDYLAPEEKHRTNMDAFIDLMLLAMSECLITSCGGYTHLAERLHENKPTVLSLIGELPAGHDVDDNDLDVDAVLQAALGRLGQGEQATTAEQ